MKIKDLFDNIQNPEYCVYNYVINNINLSNPENEVCALPKILKVVYVVFGFFSEINSGGLDYYYDVFTSYKLLADCLKEINEHYVLKIITKSDKIISKVEKRINKSITDNIENITRFESKKLQKLNHIYFKFEDNMINNLRNYVLLNQEVEI